MRCIQERIQKVSQSVSVNLFSEKQYTSNSKKDTQVNNMQKETKNFFFFLVLNSIILLLELIARRLRKDRLRSSSQAATLWTKDRL